MGTFRQLGDPVCPPCLCEHHGVAYGEEELSVHEVSTWLYYDTYSAGTPIITVPITITERCCVIVNAAAMTESSGVTDVVEIERPIGTKRVNQEEVIRSQFVDLIHKAYWEVLDPGTYTYYLVSRGGGGWYIHGAWLKIIASDCEG